MPDAYDRLRFGQGNRRNIKEPRYLASSLGSIPTSPPPTSPPGSVIGTNSQTFLATKGGTVERLSGPYTSGGRLSTPPPLPWPPTGMISLYSGGDPPSYASAVKWYQPSLPPGNDTYQVAVGLIKFDTSALPDTAQIASATLRLLCTAYNTGPETERNATFEWAPWTEPSGADADWTAVAGITAHNGIPLKTLPSNYSWVEIPLKDAPANVSKTGSTFLKGHIDGGAPSGTPLTYGGNNRYELTWMGGGYWYPYLDQGGPTTAPQLVIRYA